MHGPLNSTSSLHSLEIKFYTTVCAHKNPLFFHTFITFLSLQDSQVFCCFLYPLLLPNPLVPLNTKVMQQIVHVGSNLLQFDNTIYIYFLLKYFIKHEFYLLGNSVMRMSSLLDATTNSVVQHSFGNRFGSNWHTAFLL
jgi:hypothetical protein